jgi:hypothetical protein
LRSWRALTSIFSATDDSGPASGSGPGEISFVIAHNSTSAARTGSITIGGNTVTVTQDANVPASPPNTPGTVNFGNQAVGVTSAPKAVVISVNSGAPFEVTGLSVLPNSNEFAVEAGDCRASTPSFGSCALAVTFTPERSASEQLRSTSRLTDRR